MSGKVQFKKPVIVLVLSVVSISIFQNCGPNKFKTADSLSSINAGSTMSDGTGGSVSAGSGRSSASTSTSIDCQPQKVSWTKNGYTCEVNLSGVTADNPNVELLLADSSSPGIGTVTAYCKSGSFYFKSGTEVCSNSSSQVAQQGSTPTGSGSTTTGSGGTGTYIPPGTSPISTTGTAPVGQVGGTNVGVQGAYCTGIYTWEVNGKVCSTQIIASSMTTQGQLMYDSRGAAAGRIMLSCVNGLATEWTGADRLKECNGSSSSASNQTATVSHVVSPLKTAYNIPGDTKAIISISNVKGGDELYYCIDKQTYFCDSAPLSSYTKFLNTVPSGSVSNQYFESPDFYFWNGIDMGDHSITFRKRDSSGTETVMGKTTLSLRFNFGGGVPPATGTYSSLMPGAINVFKFWCPQGGHGGDYPADAKTYPYYNYMNPAIPSDGLQSCKYLITR